MSAAYFTDRCPAMIDTRALATGGPDLTPCRLKAGHDGPHEPVKIGAQTTSNSPAACICPNDGISGACPVHSATKRLIEATATQLLKEHSATLRRLAEDD